MRLQKTIATIAIFAMLPVYSTFAAFDLNQFNQIITDLQGTVSKYAEMIKNLQDENIKLKKALDEYKINVPSIISSTGSAAAISSPSTPAVVATLPKASTVDKYNKLIDKMNDSAKDIYSNNDLKESSSIGLFEFIEPNSFFISIDDKNNPANEKAFKKKLLYSYDADLNLKLDGIFDLDYASGYYKTLQGKNPFAKATRIRVKNPTYTGKLLSTDTAISTASTTTTTKPTVTATKPAVASIPTGTSTVTLDAVKTAYNKNKILDALKLSTEYIKADPNNIEVTKIRYRSFYILGKYSESLAEVQKIESLIGLDKMEKVVACDAKTIAKLAKNADLNKKYADACSAKK